MAESFMNERPDFMPGSPIPAYSRVVDVRKFLHNLKAFFLGVPLEILQWIWREGLPFHPEADDIHDQAYDSTSSEPK